MMNLRNNKGITMMTLAITIIVMVIIAGISITQGSKMLDTARVENYITNMAIIRAKAKVYAEEVNAKTWDLDASQKNLKRTELYQNNYQMEAVSNTADWATKVDSLVSQGGCEYYKVTKDTLTKMGLDELQEKTNNGDYIIVYNSEDYTKLDIIYNPGVEYKGNMYYSLSDMQEAL